jgi:hypothetical protein
VFFNHRYDKYGNLVTVGGVPMSFNMSAWYANVVNTNYSTTTDALQRKLFSTAVQLVSPKSVDLGTGDFRSTYQVNEAGNYSLNVYMRVGGGLRGQYYGFTDFASRPYAWRIDSMVNFSWGFESPFTRTGVPANAMFATPFPCDGFSVVWSGHLLPKASEVTRFYFEQSSNTGALLWINGTTVIDTLNQLGGAQVPYGDFLLTADEFHSIFVYVLVAMYYCICLEKFKTKCASVLFLIRPGTSAPTLATRPSLSRGRRSHATRR